jgi:transcriptional regulator with XRE-family HTH domain
MRDTSNEAVHNWSELLDELKQKESLSSDAKLAATLGVTRGYLCSVRKGRKSVSLNLAKEIFSRLGKTFDIATLEQLFVPKKVLSYTAGLSTIRNAMISRANGRCQLCGLKAPFRDADGTLYLEPHHLVPYSNGGSDTIENMVALCPNCIRKIEICPTIEDKKRLEFLAVKYSTKS